MKWAGKIMSKTDCTSNLDHGTLADAELDAVTGGMLYLPPQKPTSPEIFRDHSSPSQYD